MKKLLFGILSVLAICFASCSGCKKTQDVSLTDSTEVKVVEWNVEKITAADREYMFLNYGGDYRWFESCILMKDYMDSDEFDGSFTGVSNVFQVITDVTEKSADVHVILAAHTPNACTYDVKHGFWVEDLPLETENIKLTYAEAVEKALAVNFPKPHTKNCVLRKPVGPLDCNPQYVFGNVQEQIWVDAITGECTDSNPAFPNDPEGFKMPLGEWP